MGETGRRGTKDLALEGAATRPGRGLVFGVGGFDRRPDSTCQTNLWVRVRTLSRWKEGSIL